MPPKPATPPGNPLVLSIKASIIWLGYASVMLCPIVAIGMGINEYRNPSQTEPGTPAACAFSWKALKCEPADRCQGNFLKCKSSS